MAEIKQFSFGGGQIGHGLIGRRDLSKYYSSAFKIDNFIVRRTGSLVKRNGFSLASVSLDDSPILRIIPFYKDNATCEYLVFTELTYRVIRHSTGEASEDFDVSVVGNGMNPFGADVTSVSYVQSGDMLFFASRQHPPKQLSRSDYMIKDVRFTQLSQEYKPTLTVDSSTWTKADSSKQRTISYRVVEIVGGREARISEQVDQKMYMPPAQGSYATLNIGTQTESAVDGYDVYRNDGNGWGYIGTTVEGALESSGQVTVGEEYDFTITDTTTHLYPAAVDNVLRKPTAVVIELDATTFSNVFAINDDGDAVSALTAAYEAYALTVTARLGEQLSSPKASVTLDVADMVAQICREVNEMTFDTDEAKLTEANLRFADSTWRTKTFVWGSSSQTASQIRINVTREATAASIDPKCKVTIYYTAQSTSYTSTNKNKFVDEYITPDHSRSMPTYKNPFNSENNYPGVVTLYQQRMVWASTNNEPSQFWMSVPGDLFNMCQHENLQKDDMIDALLPLTRGANVLHAVSHKHLIFLCAFSEVVVSSGNEGLSYETIQSDQQSFMGSHPTVPPLVCGNAILFIDRAGASVREYKYDYSTDTMAGLDKSVMNSEMIAAHGGIVDWTYQMFPESIVWCVMADGTLGMMTYMPEQEVFAWAQAHLPEGLKATGIACGDALFASRDVKTSSMALTYADADGDSCVAIYTSAYADYLTEDAPNPIDGEIEMVVPDDRGELEGVKKRLVQAQIRVTCDGDDTLKVGVTGGGVYGFDDMQPSHVVIHNNAIAEAQLMSDFEIDSRILIRDVGISRTEVFNAMVSVDIGFQPAGSNANENG